MPSLSELERGFARALVADADEAVLGAILGDGLAPAARLRIYQTHVFTTLTAALKATYPVVCRLVDERFFAYAADRYVRECPPAGPCLFEYGESLPGFLAAFPPCGHLVYLPDVARFEWAINRALHAADAAAIEPRRLGDVPAGDVAGLVLTLDPSASYLASPWPVDRVWRANQPGADPDAIVDLAAGGTRLEIRRLGDDVVFRRLEADTYAFRSTLAAGHDLEQAVEAARAAGPEFHLARALRELLDEALVVGLSAPDPNDGGQRCGPMRHPR